MLVEISYGMGPPQVHTVGYQEVINGRPVPSGPRVGPRPEGVMREMMGYVEMTETTVLHEKHMSICARAYARDAGEQPAEDLWRVQVSIESESADLRRHLPVLVSAAMDHMGQSTDGPASLKLRSDDEAIRFIEKGL